VVALGDITFLGAVPAIIITSILLVSLPVALALLPLPLHVTTSIVLASPIYCDGTVTFAVVTPPLEALHGGRDDLILSVIQAKLHSKSGHQRNSCQILQNRATESRRACAELVPKLLLRIPLYVDFLILIPLCRMIMSIIASSAYLLGP
jgi:hypothetical protein